MELIQRQDPEPAASGPGDEQQPRFPGDGESKKVPAP